MKSLVPLVFVLISPALAQTANVQGGGLIAYGAGGGASALPPQFYVNGSANWTVGAVP
jgi:hypothetical protein